MWLDFIELVVDRFQKFFGILPYILSQKIINNKITWMEEVNDIRLSGLQKHVTLDKSEW